MLWRGRWEGGSCLGTHVRIKDFKIEKIKNKIKKCYVTEKGAILMMNKDIHWEANTGALS